MLPTDDADAVLIDFRIEIEVTAALFGLAGEFIGGEFPWRALLHDDGLGNVRKGGGFATKDG